MSGFSRVGSYHLHLAFPFVRDRPAAEAEAYWLKSHGAHAVSSPAVAGGYVQTHRVDIDSAGDRHRFEGLAESWLPNAEPMHRLHDVLSGPPPDFANFLDTDRATWAIHRDVAVHGDQAYGGFKSVHLLHVPNASVLPVVVDALATELARAATDTPGLRRVVVSERDLEFATRGKQSLDIVVHLWSADRATLLPVHRYGSGCVARTPGIVLLHEAAALEVVLVPPAETSRS